MTPDLFAEYRERGYHWMSQRRIREGELEPAQYWGWAPKTLAARMSSDSTK
jgi:hypothetical protein